MSVVQRDSALHAQLARLAETARLIFVAGLPGTGKSLVIHQLAHLAVAGGRAVHLMQWDIVRPVFEASPSGKRYPVVDGVTQPMIRIAVGRWARQAVAAWDRREPGTTPLLIAETPLIGHRLVELARRGDDDAEPVLGGPACRFVIAVPSVEVRRHVESERERRAAATLNPREREDAPPHVLRDLWRQLLMAAHGLGIAVAADAPYDPSIYRRVYEAVLRERAPDVVALETILPTARVSVYDFTVPCTDLVPSDDDADTFIRAAEARYPDPAALMPEIERWWVV
jgi:predicted kinase